MVSNKTTGDNVSGKGLSSKAAQVQFGRQAASYANSSVHRSGASLDAVIRYAALEPCAIAVDVGAGAGFTAFALAEYAGYVLATDIAPEMIVAASNLAADRGLSNIGMVLAEASCLPFSSGSFDLAASRWAAHHFHDLPKAMAEFRRILKPGAILIMADTVAPEGESESLWMDRMETLRDNSHQKNLKVSEWKSLLINNGFSITHSTMTTVDLELENWMLRSATPLTQVEELRSEFADASPNIASAFGIHEIEGEINFYWDTLVVRAVRT